MMFSDLVGPTALSACVDPEDPLRTGEISDITHVSSSGEIESASKDAARPSAADEDLPTLPLAPALAPGIAIKEEADANATPGNYLDDGGKEIVEALEAIPVGSALAFASEDLGAVLLADVPIVAAPKLTAKLNALPRRATAPSVFKKKQIRSHFTVMKLRSSMWRMNTRGRKARGGGRRLGFCF